MTTAAKVKGQGGVDLSTPSVERLVHYIRGCIDSSKDSSYPLAAFRHEEQWYFRSSWLDIPTLEMMVGQGFIEEAETYRTLRETGIISLHLSKKNTQTNTKTKFYRVRNSELNNLISRK